MLNSINSIGVIEESHVFVVCTAEPSHHLLLYKAPDASIVPGMVTVDVSYDTDDLSSLKINPPCKKSPDKQPIGDLNSQDEDISLLIVILFESLIMTILLFFNFEETLYCVIGISIDPIEIFFTSD